MDRFISRIGIAALLLVVAGVWLLGRPPAGCLGSAWIGFPGPLLDGWRRFERLSSEVVGPRRWSAARRMAHLERRIFELEAHIAALESADSENQRLRDLLSLATVPRTDLICASIVARDPVTWDRLFRVDRGERDGVRQGALVLGPSGVVGRVTETTRCTAVVTTILDPTSRLSVLVGPTRAPGVACGRSGQDLGGTPECSVTFLPRDRAYRPTDRVVTSGLGHVGPSGLLLGHVAADPAQRVADAIDVAFAQVRVTPVSDLSAIRHVAILSTHGSTDPAAPPR